MADTPQNKPQLDVLLFDNANDWKVWLEQNHGNPPGVWLRLTKKSAGWNSVSQAQLPLFKTRFARLYNSNCDWLC